jgi:hypothetical protein
VSLAGRATRSTRKAEQTSAKIPTEKQSAVLLDVLGKAIAEGVVAEREAGDASRRSRLPEAVGPASRSRGAMLTLLRLPC